MLQGVVINPGFYVYGYADQQFTSGFNLAQARAHAHAQAQYEAMALAHAHALAQARAHAQAQAQYNRAIEDEIYGSDIFRMYGYKVKRCTRLRSHDWTECPYAHRNEKAQRRDPRKYPYIAIACPAFRNGRCPKGDNCEYAHGVFEYWLHPARYRTRACNAGRGCTRRVCFFAHKPDELRSVECNNKSCSQCANKKGKMIPTTTMMFNTVEDQELLRMMKGGDQNQVMMMEYPSGVGESSTTAAMQQAYEVQLPPPSEPPQQLEGVTNLLDNLRKLKMREDEEKARELEMKMKNDNDVADLDLPHVDWIYELVK